MFSQPDQLRGRCRVWLGLAKQAQSNDPAKQNPEAAKQKAAAEASKVAGVKRVKNELQVVSSGVSKDVSKRDSEIEDDVERAVESDHSLKDAKIQVEVRDGVARLSGTVPNPNLKLAAESKAKKVEGVRKVQDDLRVR